MSTKLTAAGTFILADESDNGGRIRPMSPADISYYVSNRLGADTLIIRNRKIGWSKRIPLTDVRIAGQTPANGTDAVAAIAALIAAAASGGGNAGYKSYQAIMYQGNAGQAPTVRKVIKNELSGPVVWTTEGTGQYVGTLQGAFPAGRTFLFHSISQFNRMHLQGGDWSFPDQIYIETVNLATGNKEDALGDYFIEIRVVDPI